jgi:hypothetical protein
MRHIATVMLAFELDRLRKRLDVLSVRNAPDVRKAMKWNSDERGTRTAQQWRRRETRLGSWSPKEGAGS